MVIGIILALLIAGLGIGSAIYAYNKFEYSDDSKKGVIACILCVVMVICFIFVPWSFYTVDQSEVAVVKSLGKIKETRTAGTYYDFWVLNSRTKYSTKVQEVNIDDIAYSSDAQQMTLNIKFQYQIMPNKVKEITTQYGSLKTLEARITPTVRDKVKSVTSDLTAMQIIENREQLSQQASEKGSEAIGDKYYVVITSFAITNIDFSDQFETAVEEKMIAEQNALKAQYENEAKVAKAKAEAEAKVLAAKGEAEANALLEKSLTDKILQEMYLDKWDGKLPNVVAGEDVSMILPSYN